MSLWVSLSREQIGILGIDWGLTLAFYVVRHLRNVVRYLRILRGQQRVLEEGTIYRFDARRALGRYVELVVVSSSFWRKGRANGFAELNDNDTPNLESICYLS